MFLWYTRVHTALSQLANEQFDWLQVSKVVGVHTSDLASKAEKAELNRFRTQVYHNVMQVIFGSLQAPAEFRDCMTCADLITRVLFSGVPYTALDGQEAWAFTCTCGAQANFPCPHCLVPNDKLAAITQSFPPWTTNSMHQVFLHAQNAPSASAKTEILCGSGIHDVEVWSSLLLLDLDTYFHLRTFSGH